MSALLPLSVYRYMLLRITGVKRTAAKDALGGLRFDSPIVQGAEGNEGALEERVKVGGRQMQGECQQPDQTVRERQHFGHVCLVGCAEAGHQLLRVNSKGKYPNVLFKLSNMKKVVA